MEVWGTRSVCPPSGVTNAVFGIALSANGTCQYPEAGSRLEKIVAPWRWSSILSIRGRGKASFFVTSFSRLKSVHIRLLPSFLVTRRIGALYGLFDGRIMFRASMSSISFLTTVIFCRCKSMGCKLDGQRITCVNFMLTQVCLSNFVVVHCKHTSELS